MIRIEPLRNPFQLSLHVHGDKSISHRALIFASLADGESIIRGLGSGADVKSTIHVLRQLGVLIEENGDTTKVISRGLSGFQQPTEPLDAGNSGTTFRLMTGLLSGLPFTSTITGDESFQQRPMNRITEPLSRMGANINVSAGGTAPLTIHPSKLKSIDYSPFVASAQVKSAIILAGLQTESGMTVVRENTLSRRHTEVMLSAFGAPVGIDGNDVHIQRLSEPLEPFEFQVPGDPSAAAFWATAASILEESQVEIQNVCLSDERIGFFRKLQKIGSEVKLDVISEKPEKTGDIRVLHKTINKITVSEFEVPAMVDELPLMAILGAYSKNETSVRGAGELRVKESDRINAIIQNLGAMNVEVEEYDDGFEIPGAQNPTGGKLKAFHDHRIAMAFAIAALGADGSSEIDNPEIAGISYPEFWDHFELLRQEAE